MKHRLFTFQQDKLLCWRLGNMNANKQTHRAGRVAPAGRGIWCFPYPHYDFFFCFHQWEQQLPKPYRKMLGENKEYGTENMSEAQAQEFWETRERLLEEVQRRVRPTTFWWGGRFFSHIDYNGRIMGAHSWTLWDSPRDWAKVAAKTLLVFFRYKDELFKEHYTKDHLELFIPNYK